MDSAGCRSIAAPPTARPSTSRRRTCGSKATGVRLDGIDITEEHRRRDRRGLGRRGTATIRSTPSGARIPGRVAGRPCRSRARRCRACCSSPPPAPARSTSPRYDVRLRVDDLFAGDEGIGQLTGRLSLRGDAADDGFGGGVAAPRRCRARAVSR